jgi:hypothetical protein
MSKRHEPTDEQWERLQPLLLPQRPKTNAWQKTIAGSSTASGVLPGRRSYRSHHAMTRSLKHTPDQHILQQQLNCILTLYCYYEGTREQVTLQQAQ